MSVNVDQTILSTKNVGNYLKRWHHADINKNVYTYFLKSFIYLQLLPIP